MRRLLSLVQKIPALCIVALIMLYRGGISPFLPARCRFLPTCSAYGVEALQEHGLLKGGWLLIRRLGRCHPWHFLGSGSGIDPVPVKETISKSVKRHEPAR